MLVPKDIEEKKFARAMFGGYVMDEVDEFLTTVASDYEKLCNENNQLRGQIRLLAEKIEEYHSKEEAINESLTVAQKKSEDMVRETKAKCEQLLKDAEGQSRKIQEETQVKVSEKELYLAELCNGTEQYIEAIKLVMTKQEENLKNLLNKTIQVKPKSAIVAAAAAAAAEAAISAAPVEPAAPAEAAEPTVVAAPAAPAKHQKSSKKKKKADHALPIPEIQIDDDGADEATAQAIKDVVSNAMNESNPNGDGFNINYTKVNRHKK